MDGDLQDPPEMVKDFSEKINQGFDVVYGKRKKEVQVYLKKFVIKFFIISLVILVKLKCLHKLVNFA